jgi:Rieske Fe-S protein
MLRTSLKAGVMAACGGLAAVGCSGGGDGDRQEQGGVPQGQTGTEKGPENRIQLDYGRPEYEPLQKPGGAVKVDIEEEKYPLIVFRASESKAIALSSRCTHQGCEVKMPDEGRIQCPCHGSTFSVTGKQLSGPAPTPLPTYPAEVRDGSVVVRGVTRET